MAANENDIIPDQQERAALLRSIASAETALPVSAPSTRRVLENMIEGAKGRVVTLDTKIKEKQEAMVREQTATALLVQKEAALTAREQAEYSNFLKEDFFTKQDFGRLEHFYAGAWDRLSETGKEEMSHRVWEGVRHDEYRFTDLPKDVQEKESKRLYSKLSNPSIEQGRLDQIPATDRADFIRAYEAGDRIETGQVLNRETFRRNVAVNTSAEKEHRGASVGKEADDGALLANNAVTTPTAAPSVSATTADFRFAAQGLKDVIVTDAPSKSSSSSIPDAIGGKVTGRSPA